MGCDNLIREFRPRVSLAGKIKNINFSGSPLPIPGGIYNKVSLIIGWPITVSGRETESGRRLFAPPRQKFVRDVYVIKNSRYHKINNIIDRVWAVIETWVGWQNHHAELG